MQQVLTVLIWDLSLVAAKRFIGTDALLPCQKTTEFSAQKFNVTFYPDDNQAVLDVEFQSSIDGNFSADLTAYVYGIKAFTKTISGCDISKTICPISPGRFQVQTNINIPSDIVKEIPGIAYTFPDIDAVVQAKIYYVDADGNKESQNSAACVVAQLTNGKTVKHSFLSWILFGILMLGVVVGGIATMYGNLRTAGDIMSNTLSLFAYFQAMAIASMMAVNRMPPIAAAWAQNFMWTMGIISVKFMQDAITWYVHSTGGTTTNILANKDQLGIAVYKRKVYDTLLSIPKIVKPQSSWRSFGGLNKRYSIDLSSNITTTNERDPNILGKTLVVQGVERVAFLANIELSNLFTTAVTFFIFIGLLLAAVLVLMKVVLEILAKMNAKHAEKFEDYRVNFRGYTKASMFRYFYVSFAQLSFFCLWEFTDHESAATVVVAVVLFAVTIISLLIAGAKVIVLGQKSKALFQNPASILFGNPEVLNRWGYLYMQYNSSSFYFVIPALVYLFAKSTVVALGQSNGKVQSVVFFVIEVIYFIVICVIRPYLNKAMNGYNIALSVFSIVNSIFFMFFSQLFGAKADVAASFMGVAYFFLNAIVSCIYLIMMIVSCLFAIFHPHPDSRYQPVTDDRNMFMPDAGTDKVGTELDDLGEVARDGYRHSYLAENYNPGAEGHLGAQRADGTQGAFSDQHEVRPEQAVHNDMYQGYDDDMFESYRDVQSRGVLGDRMRYHRPDERLI